MSNERGGMTEWRVNWHQCPHVNYPPRVLFIEAATEDDARAIAKDHIERTYGISWFSVIRITPVKAVPAGRVLDSREVTGKHV